MKIKIVHNNEIHLFKQQNPNLLGIKQHIQKIYPNIDPNFTLAYKDTENDQISLSCQEDLQVLVDEGIQSIKIFVLTSNKPQELPQGKMVHHRHTCDGCYTYPIVGTRFKCLECQNYDLCEQCQAKDIHNHHKFFKISTQEELEQFRKEHCHKFGHWGPRGCGFNRNGPHGHGHGPHGHGPFGHEHGPFGHETFKQFREFFQDPAFQEMKQTVCTIAKDVFNVIKTEIEKHKNSKQEEQSQEESIVNDSQATQQETQLETQLETQQETQQEIQQEIQQDTTKQQNECKIQVETEEKIRELIEVLQCDEKLAKEYVECFKELPLNEIVDIILEKQ